MEAKLYTPFYLFVIVNKTFIQKSKIIFLKATETKSKGNETVKNSKMLTKRI